MSSGSVVVLEHVSADYGGPEVVCDVDLSIAPGEQHVLLGESGSGKTTLLRLIAGFESCSSGSLRIGDEVVDDGSVWVAPERRGVGVVFQDYALFPHLDVLGNVSFARRDNEHARELIEAVGLGGYERRAVAALSGGEQQRVALARALAQEPRVMLLDEPFSNLNTALRRELRSLTAGLLRERAVTAVFVTHDREEAFALGDKISVLESGRILATGSSSDLYDRPGCYGVATSVGEASVVIVDDRDGDYALTEFGRLPVRGGTGVCAIVRPEQIRVGGGTVARVERIEFQGAFIRVLLRSAHNQLVAHLARDMSLSVGDEIEVEVDGPVVLVPARGI